MTLPKTKTNKDSEKEIEEENSNNSSEAQTKEEVDLKEEFTEAEQIEDLSDKLLRAQAELQNVRRSAIQEITKVRLYGVESLAREFLSVGDNLERAIESCTNKDGFSLIAEGLELTLKSFNASMQTAGIKSVEPKGEVFNPEHHEAISIIEDEDEKENIVIEVIQKGFTIQERILRPAKVIVSKKPKKKTNKA